MGQLSASSSLRGSLPDWLGLASRLRWLPLFLSLASANRQTHRSHFPEVHGDLTEISRPGGRRRCHSPASSSLMRSANATGTTVSASRRTPRGARVSTKLAYSGGQLRVVTPLLLYLAHDVFGGVLTVCAEPVDGEVMQDAVQPGGQRRLRPEGVRSLQGAQHCLLHEVLRPAKRPW